MTLHDTPAEPTGAPVSSTEAALDKAALRRFQVAAGILTVAFAYPFWNLVQLARYSDVHSHTLLVPILVAYLWRNGSGQRGRRRTEAPRVRPASIVAAAATGMSGLAALAFRWIFAPTKQLSDVDAISLSILAFLLLLLSLAVVTLGWHRLRPHTFALCFAIFFIPLPQFAVEQLSVILQRASAEAADILMSIANIPRLRDDLVFKLPTLTIRVAEECSGVRSTFVLFMTSLVAGHMFLVHGWKKALLALAVFPLGVLRNAFRITLLSWLTVNVDAGAIDSALHHQGGPIFFVLSLIPLLLLLWVLRRSEPHGE